MTRTHKQDGRIISKTVTDRTGKILHVPLVHLNGTSKTGLIEQLETAREALETAIRKLRDAAPHQRDFYVYASDVYDKAADEQWLRVDKLRQVNAELEALLTAVNEQ